MMLGGCGLPRAFITPNDINLDLKKIDYEEITVQNIGETIAKPYRVIGHIMTRDPQLFTTTPLNSTLNIVENVSLLREVGGKMGADAIIGAVNNSYFGWEFAGANISALAVRYIDSVDENDINNTPEIVVCVLPLGDINGGDEQEITFDKDVRIIARHFLSATKGYYVLTPVDNKLDENKIDFDKLTTQKSKEICGLNADIIIKFIPEKNESDTLRLKLLAYSIRKRKYIFNSSATKNTGAIALSQFITTGLVGLFMSDQVAMGKMIGKIIAPFPSFTSTKFE